MKGNGSGRSIVCDRGSGRGIRKEEKEREETTDERERTMRKGTRSVGRKETLDGRTQWRENRGDV